MKNIKNIKDKYLHIAIIILGIIFITVPIFHENLWFDESYTVGIVNKSFGDIWTIGSNDVHPILYYWILHIIYLIFGSNIYIYRFASMIPIAILSILGYTHIRKDFGEKVGFLFSFLTLFLPISSVYSGEIRMYSLAMLIVTLMAIYAYRIYKGVATSTCSENNKEQSNIKDNKQKTKINRRKIKNWTLFAIFSLASCYIHYYGLATAGIINVILFIYLVRRSVKEHKQNKENKILTQDLKCFIVSAVIQILLYTPWFVTAIIIQLKGLSNGFWIPPPTPSIFLQLFIFQFTGDLDNLYINKAVAIIFGLLITAYSIYCVVKVKRNKKMLENAKVNDNMKSDNNEMLNKTSVSKDENIKDKAGYWSIGIYFIVMFCMVLTAIVKPLLYARYFLNLTGLFIFFLAYFITKGGKKVLTTILCIVIIIMAFVINFNVCKMNYNESNSKPLNYIKEDIQEDDLILFDNRGSGFVISMQLIDNPNCFYDKERWYVDEAYAAFGKDMIIVRSLDEMNIKDYTGRIWLISSDNYGIYDEMLEIYGDKVELIKEDKFDTGYHSYRYAISLITKK